MTRRVRKGDRVRFLPRLDGYAERDPQARRVHGYLVGKRATVKSLHEEHTADEWALLVDIEGEPGGWWRWPVASLEVEETGS